MMKKVKSFFLSDAWHSLWQDVPRVAKPVLKKVPERESP